MTKNLVNNVRDKIFLPIILKQHIYNEDCSWIATISNLVLRMFVVISFWIWNNEDVERSHCRLTSYCFYCKIKSDILRIEIEDMNIEFLDFRKSNDVNVEFITNTFLILVMLNIRFRYFSNLEYINISTFAYFWITRTNQLRFKTLKILMFVHILKNQNENFFVNPIQRSHCQLP